MSVVLLQDHFYNCPICGKELKVNNNEGKDNYVQRMYGSFQQFLCFGPLAEDPLHYYSHLTDKNGKANTLSYQEFSMDLGNKSILVAHNFVAQTTLIKVDHNTKPLELFFILSPDFPYLTSFKRKVRTAITFS